MSRPFATINQISRTFSISSAARLSSTVIRAAAASSTSSPAASASRQSSDLARTPQRRTVYARVAKPAGTTSTFRKAPVKAPAPSAASPPAKAAGQSPAPVVPDLDEFGVDEGSFPDPQPASELPDYARLAPPIETSGGQAPNVEVAASSTVLSEHPADYGRRDEIGEDWTTSFYGLSAKPFAKEVANVLLRPLTATDIEIKPGESRPTDYRKLDADSIRCLPSDGLIYLPEIKYRRTLNEAFGPGGWGMAPRGETTVGPRIVSREWGLVCLGRWVSTVDLRCVPGRLITVTRSF